VGLRKRSIDLLLDETASIARVCDGSLSTASLVADRVLPWPIDVRAFAKSSCPMPSPQVIAWVMTVQTASYSMGICCFPICKRLQAIDMRSTGRIQKARARFDHMNVSKQAGGGTGSERAFRMS
jgi:hypothetical protein